MQQVSYGPLIMSIMLIMMSIMLIMSCYIGFFNGRRGWQSLNTGPRFYLRLIRRTGWLWIFTSRTTDGRPFKPKKLIEGCCRIAWWFTSMGHLCMSSYCGESCVWFVPHTYRLRTLEGLYLATTKISPISISRVP